MREKNLTRYDAIIAGGGPAGLSTALWCDELGLSALIIESSNEFGGQLLRTYNEIGNHLGATAANGRELRDKFMSQMNSRNFDAALSSSVEEVDADAGVVKLCSGDEISFGALVVATGVRRRRLGVDGEDRFEGRGILDSGKKNAGTVTGKNVVIVGGGDAALENALILGENAASVTLVHRRDAFRARAEFVDAAVKHPRVTIRLNHRVTELRGDDDLSAVVIEESSSGQRSNIPADYLLRRIGVAPNGELIAGIARLDERGYVIVDRDCRTNVTNIFAVGDVANPSSPTVSSAVGMGATAAKAILEQLRGRP